MKIIKSGKTIRIKIKHDLVARLEYDLNLGFMALNQAIAYHTKTKKEPYEHGTLALTYYLEAGKDLAKILSIRESPLGIDRDQLIGAGYIVGKLEEFAIAMPPAFRFNIGQGAATGGTGKDLIEMIGKAPFLDMARMSRNLSNQGDYSGIVDGIKKVRQSY